MTAPEVSAVCLLLHLERHTRETLELDSVALREGVPGRVGLLEEQVRVEIEEPRRRLGALREGSTPQALTSRNEVAKRRWGWKRSMTQAMASTAPRASTSAATSAGSTTSPPIVGGRAWRPLPLPFPLPFTTSE